MRILSTKYCLYENIHMWVCAYICVRVCYVHKRRLYNLFGLNEKHLLLHKWISSVFRLPVRPPVHPSAVSPARLWMRIFSNRFWNSRNACCKQYFWISLKLSQCNAWAWHANNFNMQCNNILMSSRAKNKLHINMFYAADNSNENENENSENNEIYWQK